MENPMPALNKTTETGQQNQYQEAKKMTQLAPCLLFKHQNLFDPQHPHEKSWAKQRVPTILLSGRQAQKDTWGLLARQHSQIDELQRQ